MNNPLSCGLNPVGFKASAVTLVEGTSTFVPELLLHLCAHTAGRRNQDVVFVDGSNSFNPYTLRRITKLMQADPKTVLQRTHVARAFTEYQLNDLLVQQLTPAIKQWEPGILVVAYLPYLFGDMRVRKLLEQAVEHIKEVTRTEPWQCRHCTSGKPGAAGWCAGTMETQPVRELQECGRTAAL